MDMRTMKFILPETDINKIVNLEVGARFSVLGKKVDTYAWGWYGWELLQD